MLAILARHASHSHSCEITQSNPSLQSGMVQPVVNEMFATVHAAGSSLLGLFTSCTTFDSTRACNSQASGLAIAKHLRACSSPCTRACNSQASGLAIAKHLRACSSQAAVSLAARGSHQLAWPTDYL
eukprot:scaffold4228_cov135-Isochrysis_galbana.AAC.2